MKVFNGEQGTDEWFQLRMAVPTSSCFDRIITPKTGKPSTQSAAYICELIAERAGCPTDTYINQAMQHGIETEAEARLWYAFERNCEVSQACFCLTDDSRFGCSPDGLCGDEGGLELKCPMGKTHVKYLMDGELPTEYKAQVHGSLIVTGRDWWDFMSYCPGLPPLLIRVERDDFTAKLAECLDEFWGLYQAAIAKIDALSPQEVAA